MLLKLDQIDKKDNLIKKLNKKDRLNKLCNEAKFLFDDESKYVEKKWLLLKKLFKKENISRKECILLPFNVLKKIVSK